MAKPKTAAGYDETTTRYARATCLTVATKLGDLMDDLVVVGGLVPSLLIGRTEGEAAPVDPHVGTMDVDLGLRLELLGTRLYATLTERLRNAGFHRDVNDRGNPTRQRWRPSTHQTGVGIDFLIQPSRPGDRGGRLRDIEKDFAAVIVPGLHLAFMDSVSVPLVERTLHGDRASRRIRVCGPGAFVVLKALAFRERGEEKDAYDLYYVLRYYDTGVDAVADRLRPLLGDRDAKAAVRTLDEDFRDHDAIGPRRAAAFLNGGEPDDEIQADVVGFVTRLLDLLDHTGAAR